MGSVSVYVLDVRKIENSVENFLPALSPEQIKKAKEYKNAGDYYRSVAGAYLVNKFTPASPVFYGKNGKPYKEGVFYNISHSGSYAVIATAEREVGIDVEKVREVKNSFISKVCSLKEIDYIRSSGDFFKVWTMKESLLKCVGSGLISRLNEVPSIPEGVKEYDGERFFTKCFTICDHIISITVKTAENFEIDLKTV